MEDDDHIDIQDTCNNLGYGKKMNIKNIQHYTNLSQGTVFMAVLHFTVTLES